MATITVSNQIDAPVAEVFGRFTDLDGSATLFTNQGFTSSVWQG